MRRAPEHPVVGELEGGQRTLSAEIYRQYDGNAECDGSQGQCQVPGMPGLESEAGPQQQISAAGQDVASPTRPSRRK